MDFVVALNEQSKEPVYRQLANELRKAILDGRLKPGDKMPSTRDLCRSMKVSRFTVMRSFEDLSAQGFIKTVSGSGTYVSNPVPTQASNGGSPNAKSDKLPKISDYAHRVLSTEDMPEATAELFSELNYGAPTLDQIPLNRWREMLYKSSRYEDASLLTYDGDPFGFRPLREAIAGYLSRSRSTKCSADNICLFSGAASALDMIARLLVDPAEVVAVENPGFIGARRCFLAHGAALHPVPVDKEGLIVRHLNDSEEPVRVIYVTPSHHDPTAVFMSPARRVELLEWAQSNDAIIIEDDYDSEYRYGQQPIPALQGLDKAGSVIYLSTFWKVLFPVVRLGYIVLPSRLVPLFQKAKSLVERESPILEQRALANFIDEGHLERHIKRTRAVYALRHAALIHALTKHFRGIAEISPVSGGMHVLVRFDAKFSSDDIDRCARESNVPLVNTYDHYVVNPVDNEYIVGFAHLQEEQIAATIEDFANRLASLSVIAG